VEKLALLRIDCDLYQSTMEVLEAMYPKISKGGFVIIDDYGAVPGCRMAVDEYRARNNITSKIVHVDWTGIWWQVE
jgi:O-methyltransferase